MLDSAGFDGIDDSVLVACYQSVLSFGLLSSGLIICFVVVVVVVVDVVVVVVAVCVHVVVAFIDLMRGLIAFDLYF